MTIVLLNAAPLMKQTPGECQKDLEPSTLKYWSVGKVEKLKVERLKMLKCCKVERWRKCRKVQVCVVLSVIFCLTFQHFQFANSQHSNMSAAPTFNISTFSTFPTFNFSTFQLFLYNANLEVQLDNIEQLKSWREESSHVGNLEMLKGWWCWHVGMLGVENVEKLKMV